MSSEHKFNDDLLLTERDQERCREAYPTVSHVFDFPELRAHFLGFDRAANKAKKLSSRAGLAAVTVTCLALFAASASPLYHAAPYAHYLASGAALLGLVGATIGFFGVLHGPAKHRWLSNRLMTERLRQFHFQLILGNLENVADALASAEGRRRFQDFRVAHLAAFRQRFDEHLATELESVLGDANDDDAWIVDPPRDVEPNVVASLPDEFFAAYRELRLRHQINYAAWSLRRSTTLFDGSLIATRRLLSTISVGAILCLCALDLAVALAAPLHIVWMPAAEIHVAALCLAVLALAARATEEGTQNRVSIARYQNYKNSLRNLLKRFESSSTRPQRVQVMIETERLAFLEMKAFLNSNDEATYVM